MQYDETSLLYRMESIHELETERPGILERHRQILEPKNVGVYLPKANAVSLTNLDLTIRDMTGVLDTQLKNWLMAKLISHKLEPGTFMENVQLTLDVRTDTLYFMGAAYQKPPMPSGDPEPKRLDWRRVKDLLLPTPVGAPGLAFDNAQRY